MIRQLLNQLYNKVVSQSTRMLVRSAIAEYNKVEKLLTTEQNQQVVSILNNAINATQDINGDRIISRSVSNCIKIFNIAIKTYNTDGSEDPNQFRKTSVRFIISTLQRCSREADTMPDRRWIYNIATKVQLNNFKFTDTELKRIINYIKSDGNEQLSNSVLKRIDEICNFASRRSDIDQEPEMLKMKRNVLTWLKNKTSQKPNTQKLRY